MNFELFSEQDLLEKINEFNKLYKEKPIKDNNGGMTSAHLFSSWFVMQKYKPKYIIESGIFKGQGTWFFEKASPDSIIISIDIDLNQRVYKSKKVKYTTTDFLDSNWEDVEKDNCIIFFDDHQNSIERIKHAKKLGFKKMMFEDNYPSEVGDCYSPKKIISNKKYYINKEIYEPNIEDYNYFVNNVKTYYEFPPLFKSDKTRWRDVWNEKYPTKTELLNENLKDKYPTFWSEKMDYTWICFIELN